MDFGNNVAKKQYMTVDIETTGLHFLDDQMHGIGIGYSLEDIQYHPVWNIPDKVRRDLEDPTINKIGHNLHAFDAKFIRRFGINIQGPFDDTMVMGNLIDDTQPLGLKFLTEKYIGPENLENKKLLDRYVSEQKAGNVAGLCAKDLCNPSHPHLDIIAQYCCEDVRNTLTLFNLFRDRLKEMDHNLRSKFGFKKTPLDYYREEARPLEFVLFEIEYRGIRVDLKKVEEVRKKAEDSMHQIDALLSSLFKNRIPKVEVELYNNLCTKDPTKSKTAAKKNKPGEGSCKFKWSNNNHVASLIYNYCDLPSTLILRTEKGKLRTDKDAIQTILESKLPVSKYIKKYVEYKSQQKIVNTYTGNKKVGIVSKIRIVNGEARIFPEYRQTTGTGRLACKSPNMQNIKRDSEVKRFFIPDEGEIFDDIDYSQIELRTGAHASQDAGLVSAYVHGEDVHLRTASRLFGREITKSDDLERQAGKRTNFLTIFDGKAARLQAALKADTNHEFTINECRKFIKTWFDMYPGVRTYLDAELEFFKQYKFCISETGKLRWLPDILYGKHVDWIQTGNGQSEPRYTGPLEKIQDLLAFIRLNDTRFRGKEVPDSVLGWAAWHKYSHAVKSGYNNPIQGLAASMTKRAMIKLHQEGYKIVNQVHDSLVVARKTEDKTSKQQAIDIMENIYPLTVPVKVDVKTVTTFHPFDKIEEI